ncbi:unnamed protein product [Amoebophrya sp. A120]|nr:unnamed protein product [Amoebophrya sp. A120]|eukprot:GSA120T00014656001.1
MCDRLLPRRTHGMLFLHYLRTRATTYLLEPSGVACGWSRSRPHTGRRAALGGRLRTADN